MQEEEGAFVACTFWMVNAVVHTGQIGAATALMERAVCLVSELGLLSEQIEPNGGSFLGISRKGCLTWLSSTPLRRWWVPGPLDSRRPTDGTGLFHENGIAARRCRYLLSDHFY